MEEGARILNILVRFVYLDNVIDFPAVFFLLTSVKKLVGV